MASLAKLRSIAVPLKSANRNFFYNFVRAYSDAGKTEEVKVDLTKPGPYPKTEAERRAAAEKYGLSYEEYEPYPDDGWGLGDYPKLPMIANSLKDPYYPYDMPDEKRNYGEVMHADFNILTEDRTDIGEKPLIGYWTAPIVFTLVVGTLFGLHYYFDQYPLFRPVLEKQIPKPGVVHYTFEPAKK